MTTAKTQPADLVVEHWPVEDLVPYAKNAKKHTPESTRKLAGVIRARGHWTAPIVVRGETKEVINGHGRRLAALHLGMKTVPVVVLHGLSDAEADALRLSDNQVSNQDYDTDLLRQGLSALAESGGIDMENLGFDEKELDFLVEDPGEMLDEAFVEDIGEAVEEQKTENDAKAAAIDEAPARLAEVFGFSKVSVADGRRVKAFMARIELETGKKGAEAFMGFLTEFGI